jgi:hypothetical protein
MAITPTTPLVLVRNVTQGAMSEIAIFRQLTGFTARSKNVYTPT